MSNSPNSQGIHHLFNPNLSKTIIPAPHPDEADVVYHWKDDTKLAVNVALAARRALIVKGEPGVGKSSIAEAAAAALNWRFYRHTVTSRTSAQDLMCRIDHVRRLADAQRANTLNNTCLPDEKHYLTPGVFWWAFDPESAKRRGCLPYSAPVDHALLDDPYEENGKRNPQGAVVLIDEIDKADPTVANDLLDTLGHGRFTVEGLSQPLEIKWAFPGVNPEHDDVAKRGGLLVIFTSNDERDFPEAFLRRCVVWTMEWPGKNPAKSQERYREEREIFDIFLRQIVSSNWRRISQAAPEDAKSTEAMSLVAGVLDQIWHDRELAAEEGRRPPGIAEFFDAIAICRELGITFEKSSEDKSTESTWEIIKRLVWKKGIS